MIHIRLILNISLLLSFDSYLVTILDGLVMLQSLRINPAYLVKKFERSCKTRISFSQH